MLFPHIKHTFEVQYKQDAASWEVRGVAWRGLGVRGVRLYAGGHSVPGAWLHR